jgi:hypothetical protein
MQLLAFVILAAAMVAGYVALYRRASPRTTGAPPEYLQEPPSDLPPAMVGMLFDPVVTPDKMAATVLDLVRRGVIKMSRPGPLTSQDSRPGEDDRWLELRRDRVPGLRQFEQELVYEVFDHIGRSDRVRTGDLRAWWHAHPTTAAVIETIWSVRLRQAMVAAGLFTAKAPKAKLLLTLYAVAVVCACMLAGVLGVWAVLFFAIGAILVLWTQRLGEVSQEGADLTARYDAFRRFLADYGRFRDQPAEAVAIWEEYLPLAIVLGLGDKAEDQVRIGPPLFDRRATTGRLPDKAEGLAYIALRRGHDPALPAMKVVYDTDNGSVRISGGVAMAMTVSGPMGTWKLNPRQRPVAAFLAMSPFILFPVAAVVLVLLLGS